MSTAWGRVKELFDAALDRAPETREDFLQSACQGDEHLRREVQDLLQAHRRASADAFLESTAADDLGAWPLRIAPGNAGETVAGRYTLLEKLGEGGIGVVWKARDDRLGRLVALKFLGPQYANDRDALQRFEREARSASALNHPGVCTVYEIGEHQGRPFIAMELLEGRTLWDRLQEGPMRGSELIDTALAIVDVLHAIHGEGIAHRDLKPGNVFLTGDGRVKVLDFGLAKVAAEAETLDAFQTRTGATLGTVAYMSPEQARGEEVDLRSDLFSFGTVLYEMATARSAFQRASHGLTFDAVLNREPRAAAELAPELPRGLEQVLARALRKDRARRYASAATLRADLLRVAAGLRPPRRTSVMARLRHEGPTRRRVAGLLGLVLAVVGGAAWWRARAPAGYDAVAVLPFAVAGGDADAQYLADGVTEGVINALTRAQGLRVVPRAAVFRFRGREADLDAVGRELDVRAVVTGRIARDGDLLTVGAELVALDGQRQLWGHRYARRMRDLIAVQEDIADALAERLQPGSGRGRRRSGETSDPEAYRLYLRGRYEWQGRTGEALRRAIRSFEQALALDPRYATAHAGLAHAWLAVRDEPPLQIQPRVRAAALEALRLDPDLADAHAAVGLSRFAFEWDWAGAEASFRRAIALDPQHAPAHHGLGLLLTSRGRFADARSALDRALELDPLSPAVRADRARLEHYAGDDVAAAERFREAAGREPRPFDADGLLAVVEARRGRFETAMAAAFRAEAADDAPERRLWAAYVAALAGAADDARSRLAEAQREAAGRHLDPYRVALTLAALRDHDAAFSWLERAWRERSPGLAVLERDPAAAPLRGDPRFAGLVARIRPGAAPAAH